MKNIIKYILLLTLTACYSLADNIDPKNTNNRFAWGENVGWLNFKPSQGPGVHIYHNRVEGFVWAENIGWINLSPTTYGGVQNDGMGNLSGFAWGENVGWINFNPQVPGDTTDYGVKINGSGRMTGWAWGENIGWINFNLSANYVQVCIVTVEDLANFVAHWLDFVPRGHPADFYGDNRIDLNDFAIFSTYWLDYCPDNWRLK